ncbi:MAG: ATP-dependent Clp protease ATP-binding subunit [Deltaproteobacteria bacterium]|nr:ATP-dependent Clp protease ATP-binding subunit [Deltaproteobacteria bacterium]
MKEIIVQAEELAKESGTQVSSGYMLLAMIRSPGTAAKLLTMKGLSETKVRNQLREMKEESPGTINSLFEKALQVASPFQASEPSALHLLTAMASMTDCHAFKILDKLVADVPSIRIQALRCLTSVTAERGAVGDRIPSAAAGQIEALPLHGELRSLSPNSTPLRNTVPASAQKNLSLTERRPADSPLRLGGLRARELIEMGRDLERKQRKQRAMQLTIPGAQTTTREEEIALDIPAVEEAPRTPARKTSPIEQPVAMLELPKDRFPLLSSIGRNYTKAAFDGQLDEIIGRTQEMERMADVLNKRRANSPCLVGPAGVGKTAIVEGLALRLSQGEVPGLEERVIIEIRPADLLAGTSVRGALSERLSQLRAEVVDSRGRVILFFDEIHALLGSNDGAEAIQELKTALGRGELPCIAATTNEEYARQIEVDSALARRFTPVEVSEPSESDAIRILEGVEPAYREHHDVEFSSEALSAAVKLSSRYINDRALPDKAIALMDLAGARARRSGAEKVEASDVAHVLASQIDVPFERLAASDHERLLNLETELAANIIGHRHVLSALGETLRRNAAGFRTGRPIGSFLFLGSTGVGKTETAKALANFLFPGGGAMVRIDMSEFSEGHAVARLIGAPPGYIGHEEGGQLTQAVRRRPYCLVLLDEVEKAHPDVLKVLLQVLDDGRLTDGMGRTVPFENTVIVMTSNLGSDLRVHRRHVGFGAARKTDAVIDVTQSILTAVREAMPPELWNRIDEPLVFEPLEKEEVAQIAEMMLRNVSNQLHEEHGIAIELGEGAIDALITAGGYDPDLGARPMRRTVQRLVEGPVARMVLAGDVLPGDIVEVSGDADGISLSVTNECLAAAD